MAFENLYGNIDFMAGDKMRLQKNALAQQAIGQGMAQYNAEQNREIQRRQMDMKAEEAAVLDLGKSAEAALHKNAQGIPLNPQETAAITAYSQLKGQQMATGEFGGLVPMQTLAQRAGIGGQPPQQNMGAPSMAAPMGGGLSPPVSPATPSLMTADQFAAARTPQVTGALAGTPRGEILQAQAGVDVQKESLREERAAKNLQKYGQDQLQSATFAHRMMTANDVIDELTPDAATAKTGFIGGVAKTLVALPLGDTGTGFGEALIKSNATDEQKRYLNAAQIWVTSNLRKESGAAIGVEEMAKDYAKYFPMPLDTPQVIADKKRFRQAAEKGMIGQSAGSYDLQFGKDAPKTTSKYTEGQTATNAQGQTLTFTGGKWQ